MAITPDQMPAPYTRLNHYITITPTSMTSKARLQLNHYLQCNTCQCIAVIGDSDECKNLVREECAKLQIECEPVVNVQTMDSLEEIQRHQRENTVIREGNADRPTFIHSFLAANGFQHMPKRSRPVKIQQCSQ